MLSSERLSAVSVPRGYRDEPLSGRGGRRHEGELGDSRRSEDTDAKRFVRVRHDAGLPDISR
jgi:hypothetical protein